MTVSAAGASRQAAGPLQLQANYHTQWQKADCPAGASASALCYAIKGQEVVPGLGRTTEAYTYVMDDSTAESTSIHFVAAITVAGKGEIDASAATPAPVCTCGTSAESFDFTVTGGTGAYAGAQGSGTVSEFQRLTSTTQAVGTDKWSGTITVPGYAFDTTPPVIGGASSRAITAPKGAKRVRVTYRVAAHDPGEGSLPVACAPRSGSFFRLGRTTVHCTATDANGNTANKSFTVTVKRR